MANEDNIIIQRVLSGDTQKFGLLVNRHGPALMTFVGRIVQQQEDAEDVVQNAFVAAYQHLMDFDPQQASLSTWLQRIAYHEALCHLRKRRRQVLLPLDVGDDVPDEQAKPGRPNALATLLLRRASSEGNSLHNKLIKRLSQS